MNAISTPGNKLVVPSGMALFSVRWLHDPVLVVFQGFNSEFSQYIATCWNSGGETTWPTKRWYQHCRSGAQACSFCSLDPLVVSFD